MPLKIFTFPTSLDVAVLVATRLCKSLVHGYQCSTKMEGLGGGYDSRESMQPRSFLSPTPREDTDALPSENKIHDAYLGFHADERAGLAAACSWYGLGLRIVIVPRPLYNLAHIPHQGSASCLFMLSTRVTEASSGRDRHGIRESHTGYSYY